MRYVTLSNQRVKCVTSKYTTENKLIKVNYRKTVHLPASLWSMQWQFSVSVMWNAELTWLLATGFPFSAFFSCLISNLFQNMGEQPLPSRSSIDSLVSSPFLAKPTSLTPSIGEFSLFMLYDKWLTIGIARKFAILETESANQNALGGCETRKRREYYNFYNEETSYALGTTHEPSRRDGIREHVGLKCLFMNSVQPDTIELGIAIWRDELDHLKQLKKKIVSWMHRKIWSPKTIERKQFHECTERPL